MPCLYYYHLNLLPIVFISNIVFIDFLTFLIVMTRLYYCGQLINEYL